MYGGVTESLMEDVIERTRMTKKSTFVDIGSGIGQVTNKSVDALVMKIDIIF